MKYELIKNEPDYIVSFKLLDGPNAGCQFGIISIEDHVDTPTFDIDYKLLGWPRGILMPTTEENEEIINFVINDILHKILEETKMEIDEPIQTNKEE